MYELIKLTEHDYYIDCPSKIGIYKRDNGEVFCIDSGNSRDTGKKVLRIINENGWTLKAVLNTHSHADHIGGNAYLQSKTGCKVFAYGMEKAGAEFPLLQTLLMYGAFPLDDFKIKFLTADMSEISPFSDEDFPKEIEVVPLSGHSIDLVGYRTPDGTVYIGDAVSSEATIEKYKINFNFDIDKTEAVMESLKTLPGKRFVPSHAEVYENAEKISDLNVRTVRSVREKIFSLLKEEQTFDELLGKVFTEYCVDLIPVQYLIVGSTVRSYVSSLKNAGRINYRFENGKMLWKQCE